MASYTATVTPPNTPFVRRADQLSNHFFSATINMPDIDGFVTERYPHAHTFYTLLDRIGRKKKATNDLIEWIEKGRNRVKAAISAITATGSATITATTDTTTAAPYHIVNDVVWVTSDVKARITVIADNGGFQDLTLQKLDGTNWTAGNIGTTHTITHLYNLQAECAIAPVSRIFGGEKKTNKFSKLWRTLRVSANDFSNMAWTEYNGKPYWYFENELELMREMALDKELLITFGEETSTSFPTVSGGGGVFPFVEAGGVVGTYTAPVLESDTREHIRRLKIHSPASEFIVLCGTKHFADAEIGLRDYHVGGGVSYGLFSKAELPMGLKLSQYQSQNTLLNYVNYYPFDDPTLFPVVTGNRDYSESAYFLNLGSDSRGTPLYRLRYKMGATGEDYSYLVRIRPGIISPNPSETGNIAVDNTDCFDIYHYAYCTIEYRAANQHGLMKLA